MLIGTLMEATWPGGTGPPHNGRLFPLPGPVPGTPITHTAPPPSRPISCTLNVSLISLAMHFQILLLYHTKELVCAQLYVPSLKTTEERI